MLNMDIDASIDSIPFLLYMEEQEKAAANEEVNVETKRTLDPDDAHTR